jgi:hypothetical protein
LVSGRGALNEGTPFFLGADMRPVEPLCTFCFEMATLHKASTLADRANDVVQLRRDRRG